MRASASSLVRRARCRSARCRAKPFHRSFPSDRGNPFRICAPDSIEKALRKATETLQRGSHRKKRQQRAGIMLLLHEWADGRCLPVIPCAAARRRQNRSDMFGSRRELADAGASGFSCSVRDAKKGCQTHLSLTALKYFRLDRGMIHAKSDQPVCFFEAQTDKRGYPASFLEISGEIQLFYAGSRVARRISARAADRIRTETAARSMPTVRFYA